MENLLELKTFIRQKNAIIPTVFIKLSFKGGFTKNHVNNPFKEHNPFIAFKLQRLKVYDYLPHISMPSALRQASYASSLRLNINLCTVMITMPFNGILMTSYIFKNFTLNP